MHAADALALAVGYTFRPSSAFSYLLTDMCVSSLQLVLMQPAVALDVALLSP